MKTNHQYSRPFVKGLHILSACIWLGSCLSLMVILLGYSSRGGQETQQTTYRLLFIFCAYLTIPSSFGSMLTGIWICKTSNWGFTKYRWVITKWVSTIGAILIGAAFLGRWLLELKSSADAGWMSLLDAPHYRQIWISFAVVGSIQTIGLGLLCLLSVFKPWGKRGEIRKPAGKLGFVEQTGNETSLSRS